uniref:F-box domain-containing protein n=1 Tax=Heterorhabditis bacteriophora TaxID=37862 RepID=A0A1I7XLV5_HETBA
MSDVMACNASCSYEATSLDYDVLTTMFGRAARISSIKDAIKLQSLHSVAKRSIELAITQNQHIRMDIRAPVEFRIVGIKKEKLAHSEPVVYIQGSRVSVESAVPLLQYLLKHMKIVKRLSINIEDQDLTNLNMLLDEIIKAGHPSSQKGKGGQSIPKVAEVIRKNAKTLRVVGRIGLSEAAESFDKQIRLERLSLMTFDLGLDASSSRICDQLLEIAKSGATFYHLSYTSFVGFDPTDDIIQNFLDRCEVHSLRLTMMRGPFVLPQPDYMIGKVRNVDHLELGEVVEKPNIFNSLVTYENVFKKVFPHVDDIHYFQQW